MQMEKQRGNDIMLIESYLLEQFESVARCGTLFHQQKEPTTRR